MTLAAPHYAGNPAAYPAYKPAAGGPLRDQAELIPPAVQAQAAEASAHASPATGVKSPVNSIEDGLLQGQSPGGAASSVRYTSKFTDLMDAPARAAMSACAQRDGRAGLQSR